MATKTLGTNATTTLTALPWQIQTGTPPSAADMKTLSQLIRDDQNPGNLATFPAGTNGWLMPGGQQLFIPNRGVLQILPGDWIGVDAFGWPILVSKASIAYASTSWSHS